jgi:enoyl-[acyl-carrier protein] reductase II
MLHTEFHAEWAGREQQLAEIAPMIAPGLIADVLEGAGHEVLPFAGQTAGLIKDVRPAAEIIHGAFAEAREILSRLA